MGCFLTHHWAGSGEKKLIVFCRRNCVTETDKRVALSEGAMERDNSREREETAVQRKLQREGRCWFDCHFEKYLGQTAKSEWSQIETKKITVQEFVLYVNCCSVSFLCRREGCCAGNDKDFKWVFCASVCVSVRRHEGETRPHSGHWSAGVPVLLRRDVRVGFARLRPEGGGLLRLPVRQRHRGERHAGRRSVPSPPHACRVKGKKQRRSGKSAPLCPADCSEQDDQFSLIFTIASFVNSFSSLPSGFFYDYFGTMAARLLAMWVRPWCWPQRLGGSPVSFGL